MHEAVTRMLAKYEPRSVDDSVRALREIIQEVALLGLWRAKFFEHAAFYGGTALRILYGLDRFSEDLDFSLLTPSLDFNLARYTASLEEELQAFGFNVRVEMVDKALESAVQSAFLKANTRKELLVIEAGEELTGQVAAGQVLKVKIEVDTDRRRDLAPRPAICCNPYRLPSGATLSQIFLPARCTQSFSASGRTGSRVVIGTILSGMLLTIRT